MTTYQPFIGMHLFWWAFWIIAMIVMIAMTGIFGYNVPKRARVNSLDPHLILKRRFARGEITENEYKKISEQLCSNDALVGRVATSQASHSLVAGHPIIDGFSFSTAWAILYSLCAVLYWIAPDAILSATSKLFHGMSFTQMTQVGAGFSFGDFISVLTLGAVYTFIAGVIWSLTHSYFLRQKSEHHLGAQIEKLAVKKPQIAPVAK